jgi:phosphohistidine swiveling domain-containing protein
MFIVRTHDPVTGEAAMTADPPGDSRAEKVIAYLKELDPSDAVEAICRSGNAEMEIRPMPRTYTAEMKIAADLVRSGKITSKQALSRIRLDHFFALLRTSISNLAELTEIGRGLAAAPGAACGHVANTAAEAVQFKAEGKPCVLVVTKTSPEDMAALNAAVAIVTFTGGFTSHSAVVARQLGKPCVVSAKGAFIDGFITVDGTKGVVYKGEPKFTAGELTEDMKVILQAADASASLGVYANADTPADFKSAFELGAQGVGLCRTEHTLFSEEGIAAIQQTILGKTVKAQNLGIAMLHSFLLTHFRAVFTEAMAAGTVAATGAWRPIVIRLLDPPLHEFLPHADDAAGLAVVGKRLKMGVKTLKEQVKKLGESNPMLGHRGCRLAITKPTLYAKQVMAILRAASDIGYKGPIGIMIPLITDVKEMKYIVDPLRKLLDDHYAWDNKNITFGAMLETPRACLLAYELAEFCDFFSFGTNDLTQMTWALSRDDSGTFLPAYAENQIFEDPFQSLDLDGVGKLMAYAMESLGDRRGKVKVGICGEHGGDPRSIVFCHALGLDYVSCSAPRLTTARLAVGLSNVSAVDSFQIVKAPAPPPPANDVAEKPKPVIVNPKPVPSKSTVLQAAVAMVKVVGGPGLTLISKDEAGIISKAIPIPHPSDLSFDPKTGVIGMTAPVPGFYITEDKPLSFPIGPSVSSAYVPPEPEAPKWLVSALPATNNDVTSAPKNPIAKLAAALAGRKVQLIVGPGKSGQAPPWGVVVGHVSSPYMQLLVVAVGSSLGHDGKNLKPFIKYEIHIPAGTKIWFAQPNEINGMTP